MKEWMKELSKKENNEEFSLLVHNYFKLASMRIMQEIREKHQVPNDDVPTLMIAIFARLLNESVYAVGSNVKEGCPITNIYNKQGLLNLINILEGKHIDGLKREDLDISLEERVKGFKEFILKNADDFFC